MLRFWACALACAVLLGCSGSSGTGQSDDKTPGSYLDAGPGVAVIENATRLYLSPVSVGPNSAQLWWRQLGESAQTDVYRFTATDTVPELVGVSLSSQHSDGPLSPNTEYRYFVVVHYSADTLIVSPVLTVHTALPAPSAPQGLSCTFDGATVHLSWTAPDGSFDYYRLYRTTQIAADGNGPDTSSFSFGGLRAVIPKTAHSFAEQPGLANGIYYYAIAAVADNGFNPSRSPLSPVAPSFVACTTGTGIGFFINGGAQYVSASRCSLTVEDPLGAIQSIRFSNDYNLYNAATGELVTLASDSFSNLGNDKYGQLRSILGAGYMVPPGNSISLLAGMDLRRVPRFSELVAAPPGPAPWHLPWTLSADPDTKLVFAEITSSKNGIVQTDTMVARVRARRRTIDIALVNEGDGVVPAQRTFWLGAPGRPDTVPTVVLYEPRIEFTVDIHGDITIAPDFECWMMVTTVFANVNYVPVTTFYDWYMTKPVALSLSADAGQHDRNTRYMFDLGNEGALANAGLDELLRGSLLRADSTVVLERSQSARQLLMLSDFDLPEYGIKKFYLFLRFTDVVTGEKFTVLTGFSSTSSRNYFTSFDVYNPIAEFEFSPAQNPDHINSGDTLRGQFSFALDSVSLVDKGGARIDSVSLLVAQLPEMLRGYTKNELDTVELDRFLLSPHEWYVHPVMVPAATLEQVRWDGINISQWPSGDYLMGVVAVDEYGNRGFASNFQSISSNPWVIRIEN